MHYDIKKGLKDTARLFSPRAILIMILVLVALAAYTAFNYFSPQILAKSVDAMEQIEADARTVRPDKSAQRLRIPSAGIDAPISEKFIESNVMMQNRPPLLLLSSRRLSVGLTPAETIKKSPLYNLHKIKVGDTIYVDNTGRRAVYQVEKVEQQAAVGNLKADLVIYSYDDDEAKLAAIAVLANRQGFVDWVNDQAVLTTE